MRTGKPKYKSRVSTFIQRKWYVEVSELGVQRWMQDEIQGSFDASVYRHLINARTLPATTTPENAIARLTMAAASLTAVNTNPDTSIETGDDVVANAVLLAYGFFLQRWSKQKLHSDF
jgi:hypothetical protein